MQGGVRRPSCPICNWDIEINREELALALGMYHIASNDHYKGQASQQSNVTITDEDDDGGLEIMRSMGLIEEDEVTVTAGQTKQVNTEDHGTNPIDQDNTNETTDSTTSTLKRPNPLAFNNSQSTKKVKKSDEKKDESKTRNGVSSNVAKKLIEELSTETSQISEVSEERSSCQGI
ncbi:6722_t:CDS:1 [Acaulospora morrowiae]|uniref:6722_t:CDS:1 n=1 Tax=Acaulospora morrowiae TaxID=94023 RepID=A0A9N8YM02_9GLOM|nr:6722_t:CDS:1 [Acaulospora morrowiae]